MDNRTFLPDAPRPARVKIQARDRTSGLCHEGRVSQPRSFRMTRQFLRPSHKPVNLRGRCRLGVGIPAFAPSRSQ